MEKVPKKFSDSTNKKEFAHISEVLFYFSMQRKQVIVIAKMNKCLLFSLLRHISCL